MSLALYGVSLRIISSSANKFSTPSIPTNCNCPANQYSRAYQNQLKCIIWGKYQQCHNENPAKKYPFPFLCNKPTKALGLALGIPIRENGGYNPNQGYRYNN